MLVIKMKLKLRMKTWYWGNYILEGQMMDGTLIKRSNPDFEPYIEEAHGWHHSEEFKNGQKEKIYYGITAKNRGIE